jgi:hypothetical protein
VCAAHQADLDKGAAAVAAEANGETALTGGGGERASVGAVPVDAVRCLAEWQVLSNQPAAMYAVPGAL